jgi:hypothetical protein
MRTMLGATLLCVLCGLLLEKKDYKLYKKFCF